VEEPKNNNEKGKIRDVERAMDGEKDMGTKRGNSGAMFETMDT